MAPQHSPSNPLASSTWTTSSPHLTSDSDSKSDFGEDRDDVVPAELLGGSDGTEAYELQDRLSKPYFEHERDKEVEDDEVGVPHDGYTRRLSDSTRASFQLYTPDEERTVVRKFDRKLVLFLSACYMMSFLDRSSMLTPFTLLMASLIRPLTYLSNRYRKCATCGSGTGSPKQAPKGRLV